LIPAKVAPTSVILARGGRDTDWSHVSTAPVPMADATMLVAITIA
jgi:hypothetical protein